MLRQHVIFLILCGSSLSSCMAQEAFAQPGGPTQPNDCVTQAAAFHGQNSWILRAILKVESNFNPKARNRNRNGTEDVGIAQINSMHFPALAKYGITPDQLLNACTSSYVAAWHLGKQVAEYGNTWFAIGAYHSRTPCYNKRYSGLVWNTLVDWRVVTGGKVAVQPMTSCDAKAASTTPAKKASAGVATTAASTTALAADF